MVTSRRIGWGETMRKLIDQPTTVRSAIEALESRQFLSAAPSVGWAAHAVNFTAYEKTAFHGTVATFKANIATFDLPVYVNIAWGDGTSSGGSIQPNKAGGYNVIGTHTYAEDRNHTVNVRAT